VHHQIISSPARIARPAIGLAALLMPLACIAHPGHDLHPGFIAGIIHPFSGFDHLLAMIAVGLWAAQLGGRALWLLPATFIAVMLAGAVTANCGFIVNGFEPMILGSVFALGMLVVLFGCFSVVASAIIVASFAFFHGYAHGMELPAFASAGSYFAGFTIATAALHLTGMTIAVVLNRRSLSASRWAGAFVLLGGVSLLY
jgi:urease accessory protein